MTAPSPTGTIEISILVADGHGASVVREKRAVYHRIGSWAVTADGTDFCVTHTDSGLRAPGRSFRDLETAKHHCDAWAVIMAGVDPLKLNGKRERLERLRAVEALALRNAGGGDTQWEGVHDGEGSI